MGNNDGPILCRGSVCPIPLHDKVDGETELGQAMLTAAADARIGTERDLLLVRGRFLVVCHKGDVVPAAHELLHLASGAAGVGVEYLHHVFLRVGNFVRRLLAVLGHVERLLVVEQLEYVAALGGADDGRRHDLVHGFVVAGVGWVVDETGARSCDIYSFFSLKLAFFVLFSSVSGLGERERERESTYRLTKRSCGRPFAALCPARCG